MTTITAKQLRENLSSYLDRAQAGEEIAIIRRSAVTARLVPDAAVRQGNGPAIVAAAQKYRQYLHDNKTVFALDSKKSIKELYRESMATDVRYADYAPRSTSAK